MFCSCETTSNYKYHSITTAEPICPTTWHCKNIKQTSPKCRQFAKCFLTIMFLNQSIHSIYFYSHTSTAQGYHRWKWKCDTSSIWSEWCFKYSISMDIKYVGTNTVSLSQVPPSTSVNEHASLHYRQDKTYYLCKSLHQLAFTYSRYTSSERTCTKKTARFLLNTRSISCRVSIHLK